MIPASAAVLTPLPSSLLPAGLGSPGTAHSAWLDRGWGATGHGGHEDRAVEQPCAIPRCPTPQPLPQSRHGSSPGLRVPWHECIEKSPYDLCPWEGHGLHLSPGSVAPHGGHGQRAVTSSTSVALVWHQHGTSTAATWRLGGSQLLAHGCPIPSWLPSSHHTSLRITAAFSAGTWPGLPWGSVGQSGIFCPFLVVEEE